MSTEPKLNDLCARCAQIVTKAQALFNDGFSEVQNEIYPFPQWRQNAAWCHLCALSFHHADNRDISSLHAMWDQGHGSETAIRAEFEATIHQNVLSLLFRCDAFPLLSQLYVDISLKCDHFSSQLAPTRQLPTRLLDVGVLVSQDDHSPFSDAPQLRLCNTDELPLSIQYVTLSHCWGDHPSVAWGRHPAITLTNEVLDSFYAEVPLLHSKSPESLTFKHAVKVVRDLGYRYLWIDALCINQDDPVDKAGHVSIMDDVFANAAFSISATASASGSGGLIFVRDPKSVYPLRVPVQRPNNQCSQMMVYSNRWRQAVNDGVIHSRGWVFQERILSPRVLHFAYDQVFWECATTKAALCFPRGMPFGRRPWSGARELLKSWLEVDDLDNLEDWKRVQDIWASLIMMYSRSDLSFARDKLLAISGIARRLQKRSTTLMPDDYLAGLWRPSLVDQLLWTTDLTPKQGRPTGYRAPSWSWASLDAVIHLNTQRAKDRPVKLVEVAVQTKTPDPFGEVLAGSITLSGPFCMVTCVKASSGELTLGINGKVYPRELIQTQWDNIPVDNYSQESVIFNDFSSTPVYLLAFYPYPERAEPLFDMTGLILESTAVKAGRYTRVGVFKLWQRHPEAYDILVEAYRSKTLGSATYLNFDGRDRYCVEIV